MNREIFIHARKAAKGIHEESKHILPDHRLIFHETTIGCRESWRAIVKEAFIVKD